MIGIFQASLTGSKLSRYRKLTNLAFTIEHLTRPVTIKDQKLSASWQEVSRRLCSFRAPTTDCL